MEEHFRKLEQIYLDAPYNQHLYDDNSIEISAGRAVIQTRVSPRHFHGGGNMHGSCYFRLLDDAAYFAVNSLIDDAMIYTVSFHVHLIRPVGEGIIIAEGEVRHKGNNRLIAESTIYNMDDKVVAFGTGEFMKSPVPLENIRGYIDDKQG